MPFDINAFKAVISPTDFARPALFNVLVSTPSGVAPLIPVSPFLVRAASLPGSTMGEVAIPYGGRVVKIAGERAYGDWGITVMNDEGFIMRRALESWIEKMNGRVSNFRSFPNEYKVDLTINQFSKKGPPISVIKMVGCFPTALGDIGVDWGSANAIEEYSVTWAYDYWDVVL